MAYDANGHLTETISPSAGTTLQYYDHDGNLTENIAADDSSIVNTYDADDRLTQSVWYNPSSTVIDTQNRTYDNDGDLLTASNINGTYTFSYDYDNRLTNVQEPFGVSLSYSYDGDGNQTQVVDSYGGTQTSVYDLEGQLVTREYTGEEQHLRVDFTYNAQGQIATQTDYSNLAGTAVVSVTDTEYDADGNILDIHSYNASSTTIEHFAYTYDPADNLHSEVDTQSGVTTTTYYTYDPANQLTGAGSLSFSYDAAGNRSTTMGYTTGAGNELLSDGTYDYTYDAKGNEITKTNISTGDKWTYEYNNANEMTSAVETNSSDDIEQTESMEYDIFGNRVEVDNNGTITNYAYDMWNPAKSGATGTSGSDIWATLTSGGSLTMRELQGDGIDQHLAYVTSSSAYWYLTDHLNSIRAVLDSSGSVTASVAYDAYGNLTTAAAPGLYDWTGREFDVETGLQYNRARYYDPGTGRWISQDPMGFDAGDSNLYRYVNDGPTNAGDASGLQESPLPGRIPGQPVTDDDIAEIIRWWYGPNGLHAAKPKVGIVTDPGSSKGSGIGVPGMVRPPYEPLLVSQLKAYNKAGTGNWIVPLAFGITRPSNKKAGGVILGETSGATFQAKLLDGTPLDFTKGVQTTYWWILPIKPGQSGVTHGSSGDFESALFGLKKDTPYDFSYSIVPKANWASATFSLSIKVYYIDGVGVNDPLFQNFKLNQPVFAMPNVKAKPGGNLNEDAFKKRNITKYGPFLMKIDATWKKGEAPVVTFGD